MRFTKMNGAGNDFIIVENLRGELDEQKLSKLARTLCDRRMSIGADGLMAVVPAKGTADYGMLFFNCDGSLGEMCGNGARQNKRKCRPTQIFARALTLRRGIRYGSRSGLRTRNSPHPEDFWLMRARQAI